jgi:hypothetical protein
MKGSKDYLKTTTTTTTRKGGRGYDLVVGHMLKMHEALVLILSTKKKRRGRRKGRRGGGRRGGGEEGKGEGRKGGRKEGRREGGRKEGRKEGKKEGRKEGRKEGYTQFNFSDSLTILCWYLFLTTLQAWVSQFIILPE